jgi:hypothetical protein
MYDAETATLVRVHRGHTDDCDSFDVPGQLSYIRYGWQMSWQAGCCFLLRAAAHVYQQYARSPLVKFYRCRIIRAPTLQASCVLQAQCCSITQCRLHTWSQRNRQRTRAVYSAMCMLPTFHSDIWIRWAWMYLCLESLHVCRPADALLASAGSSSTSAPAQRAKQKRYHPGILQNCVAPHLGTMTGVQRITAIPAIPAEHEWLLHCSRKHAAARCTTVCSLKLPIEGRRFVHSTCHEVIGMPPMLLPSTRRCRAAAP